MSETRPNYGNRPPEKNGMLDAFLNGWGERLRPGVLKQTKADPLAEEKTAAIMALPARDIAAAQLFQLTRFLGLIGGILLIEFFAPAHAVLVFIIGCAVTIPFAGLLFFLSYGFARDCLARLKVMQTKKPSGIWFWGLCLFVATTGVFWWLNIALDRAPFVAGTFVISAKHENHGRHGSITDYATVSLPPSFFLRLILNAPEDVRLAGTEYQATDPGQTLLTLRLHPGFFGLPWYESRHELVNRPIVNGAAPAKTPQYIENNRNFLHPDPSP